MPTQRASQSSQSWLKNEQLPIDCFVKKKPKKEQSKRAFVSDTSGRRVSNTSTKRKSIVQDKEDIPVAKKQRTNGTVLTRLSTDVNAVSIGHKRRVLADIPTTNNSPCSRTSSIVLDSPSSPLTPLSGDESDVCIGNKLIRNPPTHEDISTVASGSSDNSPTKSISCGPTPKTSHSLTVANCAFQIPPSPSLSRMKGKKTLIRTRRSTPSSTAQLETASTKVKQTPNTLAFAAASYPTPESQSLRRLKYPSQDQKPLPVFEANPLSQTPSSPLQDNNALETIQSSQSQYIVPFVMSPIRKRFVSEPNRTLDSHAFKVPSSQIEDIFLSPPLRNMRRPQPSMIGSKQKKLPGPFLSGTIVPTSQEDEEDFRFNSMRCSASQQAPRAVGDSYTNRDNGCSIQRIENYLSKRIYTQSAQSTCSSSSRISQLPESAYSKVPSKGVWHMNSLPNKSETVNFEVDRSCSNEASEVKKSIRDLEENVSTILSAAATKSNNSDLAKASIASDRHIEEFSTFGLQVESRIDLEKESQPIDEIQSSATEPDSWNEDPFSSDPPTIAQGPSSFSRMQIVGYSQREMGTENTAFAMPTCSQTSNTQADTDDEDPFPTLPPSNAKLAAESTGRTSISSSCLASQHSTDKHTARRDDGEALAITRDWSQSVIGLPGSSRLIRDLSSGDVQSILGLRRKHRETTSSCGDDDERFELTESMPPVVREFFAMFDRDNGY